MLCNTLSSLTVKGEACLLGPGVWYFEAPMTRFDSNSAHSCDTPKTCSENLRASTTDCSLLEGLPACRSAQNCWYNVSSSPGKSIPRLSKKLTYLCNELALLIKVSGDLVAKTSLSTRNWSETSASKDSWSLIAIPRGKRKTRSYHLFNAVSNFASCDSLQEIASTVVTTCFQWLANGEALSLLQGTSTSLSNTGGIGSKLGLEKTWEIPIAKCGTFPKMLFQLPFSHGNSTSRFTSRFSHNFSKLKSEGSSAWSSMTWHSFNLSAAPAKKCECIPKPDKSPNHCFEDAPEQSEILSIESKTKFCHVFVAISDFHGKRKASHS